MSHYPHKEESAEDFAARFAHYSKKNGSTRQFEKALYTVLTGCVKKHIFEPSGRFLYTVVGRSGDEFINPDKPYCSCQHFFYRVLGGRDQLCYHLLSYKIAQESKRVDEVVFDDEEYGVFLRLLSLDLLNPMRDKEDKDR